MGSAVTMTIPALLRYDLRDVNGEWKIARLRAYWELPAMLVQFLRNGASAVPATIQLSLGLVRNQRLRGTAGFAAGFRRVGSGHKKLVDTFLSAVGAGDAPGAQRTLSPDAATTLGEDEAVSIAELVARCRGASAPRLIAAGRTVAASITSAHERGDHVRRCGQTPRQNPPDPLLPSEARRLATNTSRTVDKHFDRRTLLRGAGALGAASAGAVAEAHAVPMTMR